MSEITNTADLLDYPLGSTFTDREGDVWMLDTHQRHGSQTYLIGPETGSMEASVLLQKWGPLTPQWRPDRPAQPTVQPSAESVARALFLQRYPGSGGWDGPGWEKRRGPWLKAAEAVLALIGGRTEAEVKAEALEEAADDYELKVRGSVGEAFVGAFLRARAAAIRGEQP